MTVSVLGAGAFGTALAISLAGNGPVTLWGRDVGAMRQKGENARRLPGCPFPAALEVTHDINSACRAEILLVAVPMQKLRGFLCDHDDLLRGRILVACCKGIELSSGAGPASVITQTIATATPAILTGPSFAADIASGLPTALTLACADEALGRHLQHKLTTANLRLYRTMDVIGAELGGVLKNVIAIACGTAIGAGLGDSARAAVMTRGFAEMQKIAAFRGADPRTLVGLSGFGDLVLTCTSEQSRNYRLGLSLGRGVAFDPATTVEGAATAQAVNRLAHDNKLEMPITAAVAALLEGRLDVTTAMHALLARPLKEE